MQSSEYRKNIRVIVKNVMRRKFPGLKSKILEEAASEVAKNIHARFYGANVDNVDSPIWRDHPCTGIEFKQPDKTAQEILDETP